MPTKRKPATKRKTVKQLESDLTAAQKRAKEAYGRGWEDGADDEPAIIFGSGVMGRGYRSAKFTLRDETSTSQEAAIERSYRQFASNPLAWSIANIGTDYVWDDNGPAIKSFDEDVQRIIDRHWNDDVNDWPGKGSQRVRDLRLYGEMVLEAFVRQADGRVTLGAIDPAEIDEIITDPENREDLIALRLKSVQGEDKGGRLIKIVKQNDSRLLGVQSMELAANRAYAANDPLQAYGTSWRVLESKERDEGGYNVRVRETCTGRRWGWKRINAGTKRRPIERVTEFDAGLIDGEQYDGQCFLVQVNKTSIGLRGRPDGLALIDWLDRYDQMFFDILEHAALLKDIVWDLLVQGDDAEVKKRVNEFNSAIVKAGGVFGHNDKITVTPQNPDLKGADWGSLADTVLTLIAAGSRYPVYMLGSGGDANLATATAQGGPTYKGFKTRQGVIKRFITRVLQFVIDCAVEAGRLDEFVTVVDSKGDPVVDKDGIAKTKPAREAFEVVMPEIAVKDTTGAVAAFGGLVNAVITATSAQLLPKREAVEIIARGADLVGVTIDVEKVLEELEKSPGAAALPDQLGAAQQADGQAQADQAQTSIDDFLKALQTPEVKQN